MKRILTLFAVLMCWVVSYAVTLNVTVPAGTSACYVCGDFNGWAPGSAPQLQKVSDTQFTITMNDVTTAAMEKGYKYLCGPDWKYVEKNADGSEMSNRTSISSNDVVAKWAATYVVDANLKTATIKVNGYDRKVEVLLPPDYETSGKSYPVVYYVGVIQRYHDGGDDSYNGDNLFAANSWNVAARNAQLQAQTPSGCIFVATPSFVAENIPYANANFMGSGQSDAYLNSFESEIMGYINRTYRTKTGATNTSIMGADLGGVLALYARLSRPNVFGNCLSMSPLLWTCKEQMQSLANTSSVTGGVTMTYGSAEPAVISSNLINISGATTSVITNGLHNDESWGAALPSYIGSLMSGAQAAPAMVSVPQRAPIMHAADITTTTYQFWSAIDSQTLSLDNSASFQLIDNYYKGSTPVTAQVLVKDIAADVKTKFYWNIKRQGESAYLMSSNKDVSFSSKKSATSWLRVVILDGEVIENVAAASNAFTLQNASGKTTMTQGTGHTVKATVEFPTSNKEFTIHYGSVNSGSDMGAITTTYSVTPSCVKATVHYNFRSNSVTITEEDWAEVIDNVNVKSFQAVPAITTAGQSSKVVIELDEDAVYGAALSQSFNYGSASAVSLTSLGNNRWEANLSNLQQGIYTLTLDLTRGTAQKKGAAQIYIRVDGESSNPDAPRYLTVNAYDGIDWATIGRYKGNFHTHTSQSNDCSTSTTTTVQKYHSKGYKILALTDHDVNPWPWEHFDLFKSTSAPLNPEELGMLSVPGVELSKDNSNSWHETGGGEFNHHNDFFTGRKGQEFKYLRESYAYTMSLGGYQIINHPGQYWSLDTEYTPGEKNSPEWHIENFMTYPSLIGLEVYNQGNRRPNDRVLWDKILTTTMPGRPVWGYSCDDTHNSEQFFRNYEFMLMPELSIEALKECMRKGSLVFSYEPGATGQDLAPHINSIIVDSDACTITIDTDDATDIEWISGTDRSGGASTRKNTVVGKGKTFCYTGFAGTYVRARLINDKGETCTQPFGFSNVKPVGVEMTEATKAHVSIFPNPAEDLVNLYADSEVSRVEVYSMSGNCVLAIDGNATRLTFDVSALPTGIYLVRTQTAHGPHTQKLIVK